MEGDMDEDEYIAMRSDLTPAELEQELVAWRRARGFERRLPVNPEEELAMIWWPDDRAWFVATEASCGGSSYLAGSRRMIERLTTDARLEVLEAQLTDSLSDLRDERNAELDRAAYGR
jgi:hypothetical protein